MEDKTSEIAPQSLTNMVADHENVRLLGNNRFDVDVFAGVGPENWYRFQFLEEVDLTGLKPGKKVVIESLNLRRTRNFSPTNRGMWLEPNRIKMMKEDAERYRGKKPRLADYLTQAANHKKLAPVKREEITTETLFHGGGMRHKGLGAGIILPITSHLHNMR